MMLTDLLEAARKSGLPVVAIDGWQTRGHGPMTAVETIAVHHTATSRQASGNYPSLGIVRDGRSDLPGPLSQLGLGRDGGSTVVGHAVEGAARFFVDEIRGSLDYDAAANPGRRVQRVVLSGGGALLDGLVDRLAAATGLPVEIGSPVRRVRPARGASLAAALAASDLARTMTAATINVSCGALID